MARNKWTRRKKNYTEDEVEPRPVSKYGFRFFCCRRSARLLADNVNTDALLSLFRDDPCCRLGSVHTVEVMGRVARTQARARAGGAPAFAGCGAAQVARLHRRPYLARESHCGTSNVFYIRPPIYLLRVYACLTTLGCGEFASIVFSRKVLLLLHNKCFFERAPALLGEFDKR